jgi:SAM-dependent methyltransferase
MQHRFNSTTRFSGRVDNYVKYRPRYPKDIINFLTENGVLSKNYVVADIGSGTGISCELFLENGNRVYGIEPNTEMREAAERLLAKWTDFRSVNASAEATTLGNESIDLIVAGQAFHWFDPEKSREEFARILKPGGNCVLIWNDRRTDSTAFLKAYEALLQEYSTDYKEVDHKNIDEQKLNGFFGKGNWRENVFPNYQYFDYEGLKGRLLSSSYAPAQGHPRHEPMLNALSVLFNRYAQQNRVTIEYDTRLFYGKPGKISGSK